MRRKKGANRRDPPIVGRTKLSHGERSFQAGTVYPFPARHRYCFSEIILTTYFTSNVVLNFFWVKISEFCFLLFCQVRFIKNRQSLFFFWSWKKKKTDKAYSTEFCLMGQEKKQCCFFPPKISKSLQCKRPSTSWPTINSNGLNLLKTILSLTKKIRRI